MNRKVWLKTPLFFDGSTKSGEWKVKLQSFACAKTNCFTQKIMAILRQYHPDKNQDMPQDVANQKFREISEAFGFLWVKFMGFCSRNPPVMYMGISPKQLVVLHPWKLTVMEPPKKFMVWVDVSPFPKSGDFFVFQVLGLSFSRGGSVVRGRICFILCPDVLSLIGVVDAALLCCNYRRMPRNWKKMSP